MFQGVTGKSDVLDFVNNPGLFSFLGSEHAGLPMPARCQFAIADGTSHNVNHGSRLFRFSDCDCLKVAAGRIRLNVAVMEKEHTRWQGDPMLSRKKDVSCRRFHKTYGNGCYLDRQMGEIGVDTQGIVSRSPARTDEEDRFVKDAVLPVPADDGGQLAGDGGEGDQGFVGSFRRRPHAAE